MTASGAPATPLLELRAVSKTYGSGVLDSSHVTVALDRISLSFPDQGATMTAVAGESGSGKTTLARLLLGFIDPTAGHVFYRGTDVAAMSRQQRSQFRREVQPIFQDPFEVFNPFYRVDHVLTVPIRRYGLARTSAERRRLIEPALEMVGLRAAETLGRYPHELSGGQRQRIMVARALLLRPKVIVADEPVSMVDASLRATILSSLRRLNQELGIAVVYITHDLATAYQICDNIIVMYRGSVAEAGSVEQVIGRPKHPYTQLLVSSIPLAEPTRRWGSDAGLDSEVRSETGIGCKFAGRCPAVFDKCRTTEPPFYLPDGERAVACFLYENASVLGSMSATDVFQQPVTIGTDDEAKTRQGGRAG
ncbi:MAG: ABC transporter ATP-binding protein [Solirubrobacterales bacterium]|nr:ABC transporter ATP-binding protein [Solirubrobacterales bacterium]